MFLIVCVWYIYIMCIYTFYTLCIRKLYLVAQLLFFSLCNFFFFFVAGNSVEVDESLFQEMDDLELEDEEDDPDYNPVNLDSD